MLLEGSEVVKWYLGFGLSFAGKMGFTAPGMGFNHCKWDEHFLATLPIE